MTLNFNKFRVFLGPMRNLHHRNNLPPRGELFISKRQWFAEIKSGFIVRLVQNGLKDGDALFLGELKMV